MQMEAPISLHMHRLDHNSSKLPSFRFADFKPPAAKLTSSLSKAARDHNHNHHNNHITAPSSIAVATPERPSTSTTTSPTTTSTPTTTPPTTTASPSAACSSADPSDSSRHRSESTPDLSPKQSSPPSSPTSLSPGPSPRSRPQNTAASQRSPPVARTKDRNHHVPASHSRNDALGSGPPPAMLTQKVPRQTLDTDNSTKDWVVNQSALTPSSANSDTKSTTRSSYPSPLYPPTTPIIPPIRGLRSRRRSLEMIAASQRRISMEQDDTLKALEGFNSQRSPTRDQEEQSSDDSDLFLKLAREEAAAGRSGISRSQTYRQSLPPPNPGFQSSMSRRRGSDLESRRLSSQTEHVPQALTYRPTTWERAPTALDSSRNRYAAGSHSNPTTPRTFGGRDISPESQGSYGSRRPSAPESLLPPSRASTYRPSHLSYPAPRTYNSSPLVSRTADVNEGPVTPRAAEGTESTVSTTAPSTVWDELEDLKSRIHRLELTGKLPATSGAAMSRASNDRPPTATTTVTTMSSSPKRGRGNSISPPDSVNVEPSPTNTHPLLSSALAKSKPLLSAEVYKALEATTTDALAIAVMMGTSGQPGPISSSQSTVGASTNTVSDRQVRRKADSLCRSLTELCLALSEDKTEQAQPADKPLKRPRSNTETGNQADSVQRPPVNADLTRIKASPRALSRLEARRSSLLATSSLPSPRYTPSEVNTVNTVNTPTQSAMAGRRSSLLLRSRRAGTEEPEEEDESRFRAPSRAATELGRLRNSPREYASQQSLSENRLPSTQSSLPVRRHYISTSLTNTAGQPASSPLNLNSRRFLDRSTPERDTPSVAGRMVEDRMQRKSSIGQGFTFGRTASISRPTRPSNAADSPRAGPAGGYQ